MRFDVITAFPEAFSAYLSTSILGRAIRERRVAVRFHNPRDTALDKRRTVDGKPYGGGAGMVLMTEPILKTVAKLNNAGTRKRPKKSTVVILSAKGKQFTQKMAHDWAKRCRRLILLSGRYEGIDERVRIALGAEEISVGPYVLTDGDLPAMVVISAVSRLLPGVITPESLEEESHRRLSWGKRTTGNLEYPHYTRPEVLRWKGKTYRVPKILLSGDHKKIAVWRRQHSR